MTVSQRPSLGRTLMLVRLLVIALLFAAPASAQGQAWQRATLPSGASVDVPTAIFVEDSAPPQGSSGRRFVTADRQADLTLLTEMNEAGLSPARFLARKQPPAGIIYRRLTPHFFVVSSIRQGRIWYNRCNRAPGAMHCVLMNYPAAEKRHWEAVVTRISHSLSGG
jgi:hypothetical protein